MASPIASAIKRRYPRAFVAWIVQPECASLLKGHPDVDKIIVWDRAEWRRLIKQKKYLSLLALIKEFKRELRSYNFDMTLDLQGLFKSGFITWLSGAEHRVGLGSKEGSNWLMTKTISRSFCNDTQIGSEYRYLANQLGMPDSPWSMYVADTPIPKEKIEANKLEEILSAPYLAICPFTTRPQKHWVDANWQQVALRVRGRYHLRTIILGGPGDERRAKKLARECGAISLAGKTSLPEAAHIIKNAKLVIGVDTGLTHMGHVFGVPTIAIFGSTCPYIYPGSENSRVMYSDRSCSPCKRRPTCGGRFDCMKDIDPDKVLSTIKPLLKVKNESTSS